MTKTDYPPGWDEERVRRVLEHYESQSDEEAAREEIHDAMIAESRKNEPRVSLNDVRRRVAAGRPRRQDPPSQ